MDASKKAAPEKKAVLGLAGVFVIVLIAGPLRNAGLFSRPALVTSVASPTETVDMSKPISTVLKEHRQELENGPQIAEPAAVVANLPQLPPTYTAQDLRDPMKSFLPEPPKSEVAQVQLEQASPPPPPPALRIQGLLWGGAEAQAIINDRVYKVGDLVQGTKILEINRSGVTVEHLGQPVFYAPTRSTGGSIAQQVR